MQAKLIGLSLVLTLLLAGCNLPFGGEPSPADQPGVEQPDAEEGGQQAGAAVEQPAAQPEPTAAPVANPILHIEAGRQIRVTRIQMVSETLGWAIGGLEGTSDHIFRTSDGGSTWRDVTPREPRPEPGQPAQVAIGSFLNAQRAWVLYYPDTIEPQPLEPRVWSTQDAGESWTPSQGLDLEFLGTSEVPPMMAFQDVDNGWLLARYGAAGMHRYPVYFLRSADGGLTWEALITPTDGGLQSCRKSGVHFLDSSIGWATVSDCPVAAPELSITADGGRSWQAMPLPAPSNRPELFDSEICQAHSPQLLSAQHGALAVSCQTGLKINLIYITRDGGATWSSHLYPGGELILLNQRTAYVFGDRKIYQSIDGGQNWEWVKTVEWDGQFSFVSDLVGWAVARTGEAIALVSTTNGGQTWGLLKPTITQ